MPFCFNCGNKIQEGTKFCPECGQKLATLEMEATQEKTKDARSSTLIIDRAEPTYYSDLKGVRITPTRLIIPGKTRNEGPSTYAMANITSVKTEKREPARWCGILTACAGIVLVVVGLANRDMQAVAIFGVVLSVLGILWAVLLKPTYHLRVSSASGETDALPPTKDRQYVDSVANALNEALINRG